MNRFPILGILLTLACLQGCAEGLAQPATAVSADTPPVEATPAADSAGDSLAAIVRDLNQANLPLVPLAVTERAARAIKEYKESVGAGEETFLRVKVTPGGCSGYSYKLDMDTAFDAANDTRQRFFGVDVVVAKQSEPLLNGATLNYIQTKDQAGFHLDVPAVKKLVAPAECDSADGASASAQSGDEP